MDTSWNIMDINSFKIPAVAIDVPGVPIVLGGLKKKPVEADDTVVVGGPQKVFFENPENPTERDIQTLSTPPASDFFEIKDGKIVQKFAPIRKIIKDPQGRTDYGWNEDMRIKHLRSAYSRGWEQFPYRIMGHDGVVHIVGGGPSLKRCIKELRKYSKKKKHFILSLNKTHDFLLNLPAHGLGQPIKSWGAVLLDPCEWVKDYIKPITGVQYFIGDQCAPETFDVFEKPDINKWVWRSTNPKKDQGIPGPHMMFIPGGSTVGQRAKTIAYFCGFRTIHYWGFDSSAEITDERPEGKMHGYDKVESVKDRISVKIIDDEGFEREFVTNSHMARQAQEYIEIRDEWIKEFRQGRIQWVNEIFHGDGLLPTIAARMGLHADKRVNVTTNMAPVIGGDLANPSNGAQQHAV